MSDESEIEQVAGQTRGLLYELRGMFAEWFTVGELLAVQEWTARADRMTSVEDARWLLARVSELRDAVVTRRSAGAGPPPSRGGDR